MLLKYLIALKQKKSLLNEKPKEFKEEKSFKGFAEGRSKK